MIDSFPELLFGAAALIGALVVIVKFVVACYRIARHIDDVNTVVMRELVPNGGGSMIDAVNRIDRIVKEHEARLGKIELPPNV